MIGYDYNEDNWLESRYEARTDADLQPWGEERGLFDLDNGDADDDDDGYTDVEADADTLASAGYGTDEDYGYYGGGDDW